MSQSTAVRRRPALVTFAAILVFMLGGFELLVAITEFFKYAFGALPPDTDYSILLGILDGVYSLVLLYAGYALLQGQAIGRLIALIVTVLAAIRWFFYRKGPESPVFQGGDEWPTLLDEPLF